MIASVVVKRFACGLLVSALACGCSERPTTLLVRVELGEGVAAPALLKLRVIDEQRGVVVDDRRLPAEGRPELPSEVVLYPPGTESLGLWARAFDDADVVSAQAAQRVTPRAGEQGIVTLVLRAGVLADSDNDGTPDAVDRCPGVADPASGPCPPGEGGAPDGPGDADLGGTDADASGDADATPPDSTVDVRACNGVGDCDDNDVCTSEKCVNKICEYTPITCPKPTQKCRVARCDALQGCLVEDAPSGTSCDDGQFCSENDQCDSSGKCVSGPPRQCPTQSCKRTSCNELADRCDVSNEPNGSGCDDNDPCTQREVCQAGTCTPPSGATLTDVDGRGIHLTGHRSIALDSAGALHIVYSNTSRMWHAVRAPGSSSFNKRDVRFDPSNSEYDWPSIAFDANDNLHLAFYDSSSGTVRYAKLAAGQTSWPNNAVLIDPGDGFVSLAVANGRVHVAYVRNRALRYASASASASTVAFSGAAAASAPGDANRSVVFSAIAIDGQDKAHIAYAVGSYPAADPTKAVGDALHYATNRGGSFVSVAPSSVSADHGTWPSIAVSSGGAVFIAHSRYSTASPNQAQLYLTSKPSPSGSWRDDLVVAGGSYKGLVLDNAGNVHIVYRVFTTSPDAIGHATNRGGSWKITTLVTGNGVGRWLQLTRAATGELHAMYELEAQNRVMHLQLSACP